MTLSAYQWSYNGVTGGAGTVYRTTRFDGFLDLPEIRSNDTPQVSTDGLYVGLDVLNGLTLTVGLVVYGGNEAGLEAALDALMTATAPQGSTPLALAFNLPTFGSQHYMARPRKRAIPLLPSYRKGWTKDVLIEFFASNPALLSGES